ncbi:MAG TPA: hypothetical protein EYQ50_21745 [Verrucomicrobiales bacterium]|nr:hypothetical protein [Verrucomicrobiales bacterium]HIL70528.1 hypothetical protein [Verrucomicrobiota bacterium]
MSPRFLLWRFARQAGWFTLITNQIQATAQTKDGYIWLGTTFGLVRFNGLEFVVFNQKNTPELTHHNVRCLAADDGGGLWIGTQDGLVFFNNGVFNRIHATPEWPEDRVY